MNSYKKLILLSFIFCIFSIPSIGLSQQTTVAVNSPTRILILPFDVAGAAEPYALGFPVALERSFNVIDGVFVPPIGDGFVMYQRLQQAQRFDAASLAEPYNASVIVSGRVAADGNVQIGLSGPNYLEPEDHFYSGNLADPKRLIGEVLYGTLQTIGITPTDIDITEINAVLSQVPSLPGMQVAASSSSRILVPSKSEIDAAFALDPNSSWVLAERARTLSSGFSPTEALSVADQAVSIAPQDIEAVIVKAVVHQLAGNIEQARQAYAAALQINPNHPIALQGRASLTNDLAQAQFDLNQALIMYPRMESAYLFLAQLQSGNGGNQALQTLQKGALKVPTSQRLKRAIIEEAANIGDSSSALSYLQGLVSSSPSPESYALATSLPADIFNDALNMVREGQGRFPENVDLLIAEATLYNNNGDVASTISTLERAQQLAPTNVVVLNQLAITYARNGDIEKAQAVIESGTDTLDNIIVQYNLAQILLEAGNQNAEAVRILDAIQGVYTNDPDFFTVYGIALGRIGQIDRAVVALNEALRLNPNATEAAQARDALSQAASTTTFITDEAIVGADVSQLNEQQSALFNNAFKALADANVTQALTDLEAARALGDNPQLAFYHGYALQTEGRYQEAIAAYNVALATLPDSPTLLNNLGFASYSVGDLQTAVGHLERAVAIDPNYNEAKLNLGLISYAGGNFTRAVEVLQAVSADNPALMDVMVNINQGEEQLSFADLIARAQQQEQAQLSGVQTTGTINLSPDAQAALDEGIALLDEDRYADAAGSFARSRSVEDTAAAAFYHGIALQRSGQPDLAIEAYLRATEDFSDNPNLLNNLGFAYFVVGFSGEALLAFERALAINPSDKSTLLNYGIVNYKLERYSKAVEAWEETIRLDPTLAEAPLTIDEVTPTAPLRELLEVARQRVAG